MTSLRRLRAVLKYTKGNIPLLLVLAQNIYAKMMANQTAYGASPVAFATVANQIKELTDSQQGVKEKTVRASVRNTKRDALITTIETLRMFVQGLSDASPELGAALIEGAGMTVATVTVYAKPILAAKLGKQPGVVKLSANAGLLGKGKTRRYYNWSYSVDGGKSWLVAPSTPYSRTTIEGLPLLTTCGFRVSITDATGQAEWSQVITILVH